VLAVELALALDEIQRVWFSVRIRAISQQLCLEVVSVIVEAFR
jgi:hypothetical protein